MNAVIVKKAEPSKPATIDPLNKTILMSCRKERRRREAKEREAKAKQAEIDAERVASGKFNSIRGFERVAR